jgi:3-(3-hydroxy-phenyl)propionate hydroxylase
VITREALPVERDGVLRDWFARHALHGAIVRPDHYVWGAAADAATLDRLRARLAAQLHPVKEPA